MMKPNLLLIFTLLISHSAFGAAAVPTDPANEVYGGVAVKEDTTLKKLLADPIVADQYKLCKSKTSLDKIPGCLWEGDESLGIAPLTPDKKNDIKKIYTQEEKNSLNTDKGAIDPKAAQVDATANDVLMKTNLTHRTLDVGIDYKTDPTIKVLSDFFGKKLDEALNGTAQDKKEKKIITVDHSKFIDLYTSELGKSIVNAFTSYCMETYPSCRQPTKKDPDTGKDAFDPKGLCLIPSDKEARRKNGEENRKSLNEANFDVKEGAGWQHCIFAVTNVCYDNTSTDDDNKYSKQQACLIMDFVKTARKNLMVANQQVKFYDGLNDKGMSNIAANMKVVDNDKNLTADKLTQISSGDLDKEFKDSNNKTEKISDINTKLKKEADDCVDDTGQISTNGKCKKFLDVNTTKNEDAVTEFGLRQFVKADTLKEKLDDKGSVASYLKEEGYTDDQIKGFDSKNLDEIKQKIKDRFNDEKTAIIKAMADKIGGKTTVANGSIDQTDGGKLKAIKEDLASRNSDLKDLIHFNNIVSSYLTLTDDKTKTTSRNTASLYAEINSMDPKDSKEMSNKVKNNKDLKESETNSKMNINEINELLKYTDGVPKNPATN